MTLSNLFSVPWLRSALCAAALAAAGLAQADTAAVRPASTAPQAHPGAEAARGAQAGDQIERIIQAAPPGAGVVATPLRLLAEPPQPASPKSSLPTWFLLFGGLIGAGFVTALRRR